MACEKKIRVGDVGTVLEIEILEDCSVVLPVQTATVKTITIQRPDGTTFARDAIFSVDGTNGKIYILTIAGDLTMFGTYYIQAYLELPAWQGHSDIDEFEVEDNLG
ncbi:MAG: hypothetical protein GQ576_03505 [Methanococcoides sp.]|nr:hypothetical protein [Methanococcoides sp.]